MLEGKVTLCNIRALGESVIAKVGSSCCSLKPFHVVTHVVVVIYVIESEIWL